MTIKKSQGQSLYCISLYLPKPIFSHDQLYVATSRVKSKSGLKILIHKTENNPLTTTTNVVSKKFLTMYKCNACQHICICILGKNLCQRVLTKI